VSFVLLQLAEILFPAFVLGPGALRLLFAVLIAGFPIVVSFSWVYDITRGGLSRTDDLDEEAGPQKVLVGGILLSALLLDVTP
jgi:hypothetical protein